MPRPSAAAVALALATSACMTPYEIRDFQLRERPTAWGSMYIGLQPKGRSKEGALKVFGSPYRLTFAPRVTEAPPADCALSIVNLVVRSGGNAAPMLQVARLDLDAGIARPNEPNWRAHSAHFYYVPLSKAYVTSGAIERVDLPFAPVRLTFELVGGEACPAALRGSVAYDLTLDTHVWKGESSPLPQV